MKILLYQILTVLFWWAVLFNSFMFLMEKRSLIEAGISPGFYWIAKYYVGKWAKK
jgi:hypothetical protein